MKTIHKFPIRTTDKQIITGQFHEITHAGLDPNGSLCVWAEIDLDQQEHHLTIFVIGTGNTMPDYPMRHIGSVVQGPFVWHVYVASVK